MKSIKSAVGDASWSGCAAILLALASSFSLHGATISLTNTDAIGETSFNTGLHWANAVAPVGGNAYQSGVFRLRTPPNSSAVTFAGDSLELQSGGGELRMKTAAIVTINNFILDSGAIVDLTAPSGGNTGTLAGNVALNGIATFQAGIQASENNNVLTNSAAMSGTGGFTTTGSFGTIVLAGTNTYTGTTTINGGTVFFNGVLASPVTVSSGTMGGNGVLKGAVTNSAGGTLQPGLGGTDTSTLTVSNNLILSGTTVMMLNRANAQNSTRIAGVSTLFQGGTLMVTNAGPTLLAGDTFTLFSVGSYSGAFSATNLPALSTGLAWSNYLSLNGTLVVASTTSLPIITNLPASGVLANSATLNGQVVSPGISTPLVTVYYGTNNGGTTASAWSNSVSIGQTNGVFSALITALQSNTTYYFTTFASNSAGVAWATPPLSFATLSANPFATRVQVLTYHYDNTRQGGNTNETLLTLANVNTNTFGKLFSYSVDGYVYCEPLIMTNVAIAGQGTHDVVLVATEHGTVYAFDANDNSGANGGLLWSTNLGIALASSLPEVGNRYNMGGCKCMTDIVPEVGVTGTPVIDPATGTLYVNMFTRETTASTTNYFHRIHALDVTSGQERAYSPVLVAGSVPGRGVDSVGGVMTFNAKYANQRPALTLANGMLFVAYAGYADTDPYHGWLFGYNATNLTLQTNYIFNTTPNASTSVFGSHAAEGGIWQGGGGLCVDSSNNLYFETGNGSFSANTNGGDYADSFMKISTTNGFAIADYFTPYDQATLAQYDTDLGSCGPVLLPDSVGSATHPHLLAGIGKSGKIYLIDRDTMTAGNVHYQGNVSDSQIVQSFSAVGGTWSPLSYWNGLIYAQPSSGAMKSFRITNGVINTTATATGAASFGQFNGGPVISSSGTNSGIVWVINGNSGSTGAAGTLYAFNATNISQLLWSSAQLAARDSMGNGIKMTTPTVAGGRVYVGAQYTLSVYGLATFLPAPAITPNGGTFTNSILVTISDAAPNAAIYYTTDGTTPTANSTLYTGSFVITTTTTVRAIAVQAGYVNSAVASASFVSSLNLPPPPWQTSDVGSVAAAGSAFFSNGVFIVNGSGADVWGTADGFRFVYLLLTNGCDISARVTSQGNTDPWAKAGVMIRDSLAANAAYGYMAITPGNGFAFQYRSTNGISSDGSVSGGALNTAPNNWVRLTRTNNTFTAYESADGAAWTLVGTATLAVTNSGYYAGLAVTAHNDGSISSANLDFVTVNGVTYSNPPPAVVLLGPSEGSSYTAAAAVTITADADALYDSIERVDFYADATFLGSVSNVPYALTATGLGAGAYSLTAVAVSSIGLTNTSSPVNIVVAAGSGQPYGLTNRFAVNPFLNMPMTSAGSVPPLLSMTGVFSNTPGMMVSNGVIPYLPNTPLWSDGAIKTRFVAVPHIGNAITPDEQITFTTNGYWTFPAGTVFVKTFELNTDTTHPNVRRRLETRLLVRDINGAVYGVTYKWRADNSDADLLSSSLLEDIAITNASGVTTQTWYYPSQADCLTCHTPVANYVLGLSTRQLNGSQIYSNGVTDNQLRALNRIGMFNPAFNESAITNFEKLSSITNTSASFEDRARSYLDANCAQCHQPGGSGTTFDARYDTPLASQHITNYPAGISLGYDNARIIAAKDVWRSVIWQRMNTTNDAIKMPPLARALIDTNAVAVMTSWINSLSGTPALAPPTITPAGGSFFNGIGVTMQAPDTNAAIYFTLDGSLPTTNSFLYSGVFNLTTNATVLASAFETNYIHSVAVNALFLIQPLQFTSQGFSNGVFRLQFLGSPGSNYVLQVSTNLQNWTPLATNPIGATNMLNFVDPNASNYPTRFYRVLQQ